MLGVQSLPAVTGKLYSDVVKSTKALVIPICINPAVNTVNTHHSDFKTSKMSKNVKLVARKKLTITRQHRGNTPFRSHASIPLSNRLTPLQSTDHTSVDSAKVLHSDSIREGKSESSRIKSKYIDKDKGNSHNSGKKMLPSSTVVAPVPEASKYDLGLLSMAKKREKVEKAKRLPANRHIFEQNKGKFGFLPVSNFPTPLLDNSDNEEVDLITAHNRLIRDGRPNYKGLQIPIKSGLKPDKFAFYLKNYWDWQIPLFVKFGFPLDIDRDQPIFSEKINHKSALEHPSHVEKYIAEEIQHGAIMGPFNSPPFPLHTSPFLTREKSNSKDRRIIVDLS